MRLCVHLLSANYYHDTLKRTEKPVPTSIETISVSGPGPPPKAVNE